MDRAVAIAAAGINFALLNVTQEDEERMAVVLASIQKEVERWDNLDDLVLALSYDQLRAKHVSREEAARRASILLRRTITMQAWRMAVDRWAAKHDLPKVALYKLRRPKTTNHA